MKDSKVEREEQIRDETLMSNATRPYQAFNEHDEQLMMQEEAHYVHTMNAFVELMVVYGSDKVLNDLKTAIGWKKAW